MRKALVLSTLLMALTLVSCSTSTPSAISPSPTPTLVPVEVVKETFTTLAYYPNASLHPITGENTVNLGLSGLVYQGLFSVSPTFTAVPTLCSSYAVTEDGLTWTFYLDNTARFSDGSMLLPSDVTYSLSLAKNSTLYATRLEKVASIAIADSTASDNAVVITLSQPVGDLPVLLDIPIVREQTTENMSQSLPPLGTGSYYFSGFDSTLSLQPINQTDGVISLYPISSSSDLIYGFETQKISLVSTDVLGSNQLSFSGTYETHLYSTSELLFVGFEMTNGFCSDPTLRQLLQQAFDREYIAASLLSNHLTVATVPISPSSPYYPEDIAQSLDYDSQSVALGLADLGWELGEEGYLTSNGQTLTLDLVVFSDNQSQALIGKYLTQALEELGILVNFRPLSWEDYLTALATGDFDLYLGETRLTATFDLSAFTQLNGSLNFGGYSDEETTLLQSNLYTTIQTDPIDAYTQFYTHLAENPPFVVLGFCNWSLLTQWGQFDQCTPTQQNLFYLFEDWYVPTS